MIDDQRATLIELDRVRRMLVVLGAASAAAAGAAALVLCASWLYLGVVDRDRGVPVLLPVMAIAAVLVAGVLLAGYDELRRAARPR